MHLKDKELLAELVDHGQASIYKNENLEDDDLLAVVNVSFIEEQDIILQIYRHLHPFDSILMTLDSVVLSFVSRGYIYILKVSLKLVENNLLQVLTVIDAKVHRLREHFRVDVFIDFKVSLLDESGATQCSIPVKCDRISNLSGGGFFFYALADLPEHRMLQISLNLKDYGRISIKGNIIRCRLMGDESIYFGIAVRFIDIPAEEYEAILDFLYSVQRKQLKTGSFKESEQNV